MKKTILILLLLLPSLKSMSQFNIIGSVLDSVTGLPVPNVRVTLFNSDTTLFWEDRTMTNGNYSFNNIPADTFSMGAAYPDEEYKQITIILTGDTVLNDLQLAPETHPGRWDVIVQSPEPLGGTDLGTLMPDGKIFYCHNTTEPFYFDPETNDTIVFAGDSAVQGCLGPELMPDGLLVMAGGTLQNVYGPGTTKVKTFDYLTNTWTVRNSMLDYRWYPSITKLADNRLLIAGGGNLNNPQRTNTSELYDVATWTTQFTDTLAIGNEVSPIVVLHNGKVLMTHRPPQLFDPSTLQWDSAGQFVQSPRMPNGDHADHELVVLSSGEVIAVGYKSFNANPGTFIERYDPVTDSWMSGTSINPIRSRAKTVLLPNEKILAMGGYKEDANDTTVTNQYNYMNLCDEYNPTTDSWRRLARLNFYREYHCNTILVPDGRVIAVGGEGEPGNEPTFSVIEGFSPPYLFRGVRPAISNLSTMSFQRGANFSFTVNYTDSLTAVILIAAQNVTHFMNSGNNRFLYLPFTQSGSLVNASVPNDSLIIPDGHYMLFGMVDDIPSVSKIIKVENPVAISVNEINEAQKEFAVYPNPARNSVTVAFKNTNANPKIISLRDLSGRVIKQWQKNSADDKMEIPLHDISQGCYFISVKSGNEISIQKLINL